MQHNIHTHMIVILNLVLIDVICEFCSVRFHVFNVSLYIGFVRFCEFTFVY